jgi:anhydro-N-acetylmuramic acid kinase
MSGTSADGIDAALCRIRGRGSDLRLDLIGHLAAPFDDVLRDRIHRVGSVRDLCELNFLLGDSFAAAALALLRDLDVAAQDVHAIGSHGQTVLHLPATLTAVPSTLQVGEAAVIAERTGIVTLSDFRVRDMAAGGNGAPLVPFADFHLFRAPGRVRALQNIGGIANVSIIGASLADTLAFDVGPGNMILDHLARRATGGAERCDRDGHLSARGTPIPALLEELAAHPFLAAPLPRSAGRELFGEGFSEGLWQRFSSQPYDLIATAAQFTVRAIRSAFEAFVFPRFTVDELVVSGGGSRNRTLMEGLSRVMAPLRVLPLDALGFPERAKEAAAFALLAHACLNGEPQNLPAATGARHPVVMGKISL